MLGWLRKRPADPNVRLSRSPHGGAMGIGQPAVTGYYPNIISGSSRGGPREVKLGGTNPFNVTDNRPAQTSVQNDKLVSYQRYPYYHVSSVIVPREFSERPSGRQDPLASGKTRPTLHTMSRDYYVARGTTDTRNLDNNVVEFSTVGVQDGVSYTTTLDPITSNPRLSPYSEESSVIKIAPSGPHGTHSRSPYKQKAVTNANYQAKVQQRATAQNKLGNSNRAGQSFSATTEHLNTGTGEYTRGVASGTRY